MEKLHTNSEQLPSMINSLKEVVTIIMGLALTNAIVQFVLLNNKVVEIADLNLDSMLAFFLLVINGVRFYHGNMRYLDVTYMLESVQPSTSAPKQHHKGEKVSIDFFSVLAESLIFCVMTFYQRKLPYLFSLFIILLIVDVSWFFVMYQFVPDKATFKYQKFWIENNVGAIFLMFIFTICSVSNAVDSEVVNKILFAILFINTALDYIICRKFYFPVYKGDESQR